MGDAARYPPAARVVAALGAVAAGVVFGVLLPTNFLAAGLPWTAAACAASTVPLVLFLGLLAAAPDALQALLRRVSRVDLRDRGHVGAAVVMAGTLFYVFGLGGLVNGAFALETMVRGDEQPALSGEDVMEGLVTNLVVLVLPPLLYVSFVGGHGPVGALRELGVRQEGWARAAGVGAGIALLFIVLIALVSALAMSLDLPIPDNERALEIARSVTPLGALGIAVVSSVSEEVFFRGFLQPRIGLVAQAVVFSLVHLSYGNVLELVVTFALGLAFGVAYKRTGSLVAPVAAHFLFNLVMLLAGIYAPEAA